LKLQETANGNLESLLKKTSEYCRRLESAVIDFICREEIKETIDPALDYPQPKNAREAIASWNKPPVPPPSMWKIHKSYTYDYQCLGTAGKITENRNLLEENGKKKNDPKAKLKTEVFIFGTAFLGPAGIFAERFQKDYVYTVVGRETLDERPAIIIEAVPKPDAPETKTLYGKAWIDAETAAILRIDWNEGRIGHFEIFEKRGRSFDRKPRITIRSEFRAEKNGLHFLSRLIAEEAYLNQRGRAFVRSKTDVVYKDFKFFTVEVDVREK